MKKISLTVTVLAFVFSFATFWLLESPLKYMLYFFEATLILIVYYSLTRNPKEVTFGIEERKVTELDARRYIDYFLITCAISLLLLNMAGLADNYVGVVLGVIVALYTPGWSLIRITSIFNNREGIELLVIPFILSIPISSLMFSAFLIIERIDKFVFLLAYLVLSVLPLIKAISKHEKGRSVMTVSLPFSFPALLWLVAFFSFAILSAYPRMAFEPGLDIVRHFSLANQLTLAPAAYNGAELWFHIHQASVYVLSESSMQIFYTTIAFLSIFSILSFYLMSKAYLTNIDERLPTLATLLWGAFSGLGWLYFLNERIINSDTSTYYNLLYDANNRSYWDVGYGQGWIWIWYRPLTLGLTIFFALLYLLREYRLGKRAFMFTFALLLLTLNFVHFSESVVFVLFLFGLSLLKLTKELRVSESATSSAIAMMISLPLLLVYENVVGMSISVPSPSQLVLLTAVSSLSILLSRHNKRPRIKFWTVTQWLVSGLSLIYIWLLATWFTTAKNFSVSYVGAPIYGVPWQFYPVLLGLGGLFAISASGKIIKLYSKNPITIFLLLLLFAIVFGRLLTYYNINVSGTGYWERRIVPITYAAACILAPISIIELFKRIQDKKVPLLVVLLSFMVILGTTSTFLTLELQIHNAKNYTLSDEDLQAVTLLNNASADKVLLTVTDYSRFVAEFAPSSWLINYYRYQLWPATSPELPLNVLYSMDKPVYIFLREADMQEISKKYSVGYLSTHYSLTLPNNSNENGSITSLPNMVAPSASAQTLLVVPNSQDQAIWYAYDILSQAGCNYSTALIDDIITLSKAQTLIAPTEDVALQLIHYRDLFDLKFDKLITLNLNGYENLAADLFSSPKMTLSLDEESKEKATLEFSEASADNITEIATSQEFAIRSKYDGDNFFALLDENLNNWVPSGIGSGNISLPELSLNYENKASGNASVEIGVGQGGFAYWQLAKSLSGPANLSDFDFISLCWYGRGDGKNYVLNFHSDSSSNYWYYFRDTWLGWKKVIIPMRIPDGNYNLNGVTFVKATNGAPTWNNIVKVEIRNEGSNPNLSGTFLIDKFGFESAQTISLSVTMQGSVNSFGLSNYNGTNWRNLAELSSNETASTSNYTLMNNMNSRTVLGERAILNITMTKESDFSTIGISVRLPPDLGDIDLSSIKMRITPDIPKIKVNEIIGPNSSLSLIGEPYAVPLTTSNNVISWYSGKEGTVPFSINESTNGFEKIYVNMYPMVTDASYDESNYEIFGKTLEFVDTDNSIPKAEVKAENPVQGNLATFSGVDFDGNVTVYSDSSVIIVNGDGSLTLVFNDIEMPNVTKIVFAEEVTLKMRNGSLGQGEGFYSNVHSNELIANSNTTTLGATLLEFANGTATIMNIPAHAAEIIGDSIAVLRQPTVQAEGNTNFNNLYTYALLSETLGILGYNATLQGKLNFKVIFGDTFTVTNNFSYAGQITSSYVKYNYNELEALKQSFPILIIMSLLYLAMYALRESTTSPENNKHELKKADI